MENNVWSCLDRMVTCNMAVQVYKNYRVGRLHIIRHMKTRFKPRESCLAHQHGLVVLDECRRIRHNLVKPYFFKVKHKRSTRYLPADVHGPLLCEP